MKASKKWSSHSPAALPDRESRASWPSAESRAYPRTRSTTAASDDPSVGSASAIVAIPASVVAALTSVTASGVRPSTYAPAASGRPRGRLTKREYAAAPLDDFCASCSRVIAAPNSDMGTSRKRRGELLGSGGDGLSARPRPCRESYPGGRG
ncbi:Uncharacterised protein [Mycobacteroides abscessus]|nr:Uncharacterised protein [Mycobacteroides abscessus]